MLTGRPPFQSAGTVETIRQIVELEPVPPRTLNPEVPKDVQTICIKCLQKSPAQRYKSAERLVQDLSRWLNGQPIVARPVSRTERLWMWCKRK